MSPWLFVAIWYAARGFFHFSFTRSSLLKDLKVIKRKYIILAAICALQWPFFAVAVTLIDPAVATVLFGAWPVFFGLLTLTRFWRKHALKETQHKQDNQETKSKIIAMLVMLVFGAAGVSLVVLSDNEAGLSGWTRGAAIGLFLAGLSALFTAGSSMTTNLMGADQKPSLPKRESAAVGVSGLTCVRLVLAPVLIGFGLLIDADMRWGITASGLSFALCTGILNPIANWCFQHALHFARDEHGREAAGVNALYYLQPVISLMLLVVFGATDIARPDLLIAGAAGAVAVNMVLHLDPEGASSRQGQSGYGYRALVLAVWLSGVMVLFRDDWLPENWQVWSVVEYWGILGLLATVFILVYSFQQSRVGVLRLGADELMLRLHHEFNVMHLSDSAQSAVDSSENISAEECMKQLRVIDSSQGKRFNDAYLKLRSDLEKLTVSSADASDTAAAQRWSSLLVDVERLVILRQQGRGFAEPAVLSMIAALIAVLAVVARPVNALEPFALWVHDSVSVTIAAAFLFLWFDIFDKQHAADAPVFREVSDKPQKEHDQLPCWRLELLFYEDRRVQRIITAGLGAVLLIGAIAMLGIKWMA